MTLLLIGSFGISVLAGIVAIALGKKDVGLILFGVALLLLVATAILLWQFTNSRM